MFANPTYRRAENCPEACTDSNELVAGVWSIILDPANLALDAGTLRKIRSSDSE